MSVYYKCVYTSYVTLSPASLTVVEDAHTHSYLKLSVF